jgi:hypothetical protein
MEKLEKYYTLMGEELFKRHLYLKSSEAKVAELVQRMENSLKEEQEQENAKKHSPRSQ